MLERCEGFETKSNDLAQYTLWWTSGGGIMVAFFSLEDCSVRAFLNFGGPPPTISKSILLPKSKIGFKMCDK